MSNITESHTWTVSDLTLAIKGCLEAPFSRIQVEGEISNLKKQASGHYYFTLKDSQSQIPAVMFRTAATGLSFLPQDGDKVTVDGSLSVYVPGGRYQLAVNAMEKKGLGELLLRLEALKREIHARGWFSKEHKKALPLLPKTIGVVTSPTGAAIQDILNVLTRRSAGFRLILNPVRVQGEGSAEEIAAAIDYFNDKVPVDVLIIGRGGGSLEDLWAFNEEVVAAAVFRSKIPIICAVGHETDHTIAEYVADVRAPTPSAAAEIVMAEREQKVKWLLAAHERFTYTLKQLLEYRRAKLHGLLLQPLFQGSDAILSRHYQYLDDLVEGCRRAILLRMERQHSVIRQLNALLQTSQPARKIMAMRRETLQWRRAFEEKISSLLFRQRERLSAVTKAQRENLLRLLEKIRQRQPLQHLTQALDKALGHRVRLLHQNVVAAAASTRALSPLRLMERGYSVVFDEIKGSVITDAKQVKEGSSLRIKLRRGEILTTVNKVITHEQES